MGSDEASATFNAMGGATLVAVTFIWDYVQLRFEGLQLTDVAQLTTYVLPTVTLAHRSWTSREDGWRDSICARIGAVLRRACCSDRRLRLDFEDGAVLAVSLRDEDCIGPEAFTLSVPGHDLIVG